MHTKVKFSKIKTLLESEGKPTRKQVSTYKSNKVTVTEERTPEQALAMTLCPRGPAYLSQMPPTSQHTAARYQHSS